MPKIIKDLDLNKNEIQNVVLQPLSTPPSDPKLGQKYFNTNDNNEYRWNGTAWVTYQAPISTTSASTISIPNGIVKGDGSTLTAATAGTDYQAPLPSQTGNSGKFLTTNGTALSWASPPGAPVTSVNTKTGDVVLTAADVGAATSSDISTAINALDGGTIGTGGTTKTITSLSQSNGNVSATFSDIAFPVTSVNTKTGAVSLTASDVGAQSTVTASGILKGNGSGTISAAVAGTDYQTPLTAGTDYQTPLVAGTDYQTPITFDGTYNASTNKAATVSTVTDAINALDGGTIGTGSASKTITSLSQSNGNVSATFGDISITKSQVSDFPNIPSWALESSKPTYTASEVGAVATTAVGAASGVAPLNSSSKIDSTYLPSYVDDVIEGYYNSTDGKFYEESTYTTEITGEAGKIYVDLTSNLTYRWSGTEFVEISSGGSVVSISRDLTSGTKIGTITINGTGTDLYAPTDTDTQVTQTKGTYSSYTYWRPLVNGSSSNSSAVSAFSTTTNTTYTFDNLRYQPSTGTLRAHSYNVAPTAAGTTASGNYMSSDSSNNIWFMVNNAQDCVLCLYSNGTTKTVRAGGSAAGTVDLGTSTNNWKDLYLGGTIYNNPASTTVASGDKILVNDTSAGTISSGITLGSSTTQYLANNGSWQNIPTVPTNCEVLITHVASTWATSTSYATMETARTSGGIVYFIYGEQTAIATYASGVGYTANLIYIDSGVLYQKTFSIDSTDELTVTESSYTFPTIYNGATS